jgi:Protein of unknown function (DUF4054)
MTVSVESFIADFPEFENAPPSIIGYWLQLSVAFVDPNVFGNFADAATELVTAHHVALRLRSIQDVQGGGTPGVTVGAIATKAVGGASVAYYVGETGEINGASWNQTQYGRDYMQLVQIYGAGGIQLTGGSTPLPGLNNVFGIFGIQ